MKTYIKNRQKKVVTLSMWVKNCATEVTLQNKKFKKITLINNKNLIAIWILGKSTFMAF